MGSLAHTELIDLVLAVTFNLVFGPLSDSVELIPQTMRPNPGQLLQLEFNGTKVIFVRDPANDHAKVAETVPAWALVVMMMLVFCLLVGLSFLPRAPGGKFPAPTMLLWAVGVTIVITDSVKHYVGRQRRPLRPCPTLARRRRCAHIERKNSAPSQAPPELVLGLRLERGAPQMHGRLRGRAKLLSIR